jgi:hypothetical protein
VPSNHFWKTRKQKSFQNRQNTDKQQTEKEHVPTNYIYVSSWQTKLFLRQRHAAFTLLKAKNNNFPHKQGQKFHENNYKSSIFGINKHL